MNFEINEEHRTFLDTFRNFCKKEIEPYTAESEKEGMIPRFHYKKLYEIGYTGLMHEEKYGGSDSGYELSVLAQEILSEYCGSTFFSSGASVGLFGLPLREYGTEAQKEKYLPNIIKGDIIGALAVTEPGAGSDVSNIQTKAVKKGENYYISGQKTYITNAPICDFALVLADTFDGDKKIGQTVFIVDMETSGVSRGKPMDKMGLRGSPTGEIFFDNAEVSESDILGKKGRGFKIIMDAFNRERISLGAYSTGVMAACLAESRRYSKERKSFGRPISKHQSVAFMLAEMLTKYTASKELLHETAWMMDKFSDREGELHNGYPVDLTAKTSIIKLLSSTYAREVCNMAVQIHGGAGYMEEYKVCRLYRDIKIAEIGGGTSEIQKQIIARSEGKRVR